MTDLPGSAVDSTRFKYPLSRLSGQLSPSRGENPFRWQPTKIIAGSNQFDEGGQKRLNLVEFIIWLWHFTALRPRCPSIGFLVSPPHLFQIVPPGSIIPFLLGPCPLRAASGYILINTCTVVPKHEPHLESTSISGSTDLCTVSHLIIVIVWVFTEVHFHQVESFDRLIVLAIWQDRAPAFPPVPVYSFRSQYLSTFFIYVSTICLFFAIQYFNDPVDHLTKRLTAE